MEEFPPLVERARALAKQEGFPLTREEAGPARASACLPGVGRFLAMLAAGCTGGRIGELGTGVFVRRAFESTRRVALGSCPPRAPTDPYVPN